MARPHFRRRPRPRTRSVPRALWVQPPSPGPMRHRTERGRNRNCVRKVRALVRWRTDYGSWRAGPSYIQGPPTAVGTKAISRPQLPTGAKGQTTAASPQPMAAPDRSRWPEPKRTSGHVQGSVRLGAPCDSQSAVVFQRPPSRVGGSTSSRIDYQVPLACRCQEPNEPCLFPTFS